MSADRITVRKSTGFTPIRLASGQESVLPVDLMEEKLEGDRMATCGRREGWESGVIGAASKATREAAGRLRKGGGDPTKEQVVKQSVFR
jgi:hypothetical protein